jgi:signal transduction histidine kinase/DNA-binding NarL/FixJ family response regulator
LSARQFATGLPEGQHPEGQHLEGQHPAGQHPEGQHLEGGHSVAARAASLIAVAEDLAGEFSLRPLLERILRRCTELLGCDAGSICSVDEAAGTYRKEADIGVACQSGRVFPLTEGMTGAVVAHRGPVWFARYDDVPGGHVADEARATLRGVIGVPLEWRGRIIGACIVFSRDERRVFGPDDAELLELFAKHAAIALANARMHEVAEERVRAEAVAAERDRLLGEMHDSLAQRLVSVRVHLDSAERDLAAIAGGASAGGADGDQGGAVEDGIGVVAEHLRQAGAAARDALAEARMTLLGLAASPLDGRTLDAALRSEAAWAQSIGQLEVRYVSAGTPVPLDGRLAHEVLRVAREALTNIVRHAQAHSVRLGLLYEQAAVSLLVQDDGQGFDPKSGWQSERFGLRAMTERARELGATVDVDSLAGWGTRIRARFPYRRDEEQAGPRLRVLVGAGQPVLRAGLARLLSWNEPGIEVIGEVATAEQALDACRTLRPDVVLVDLGLPAGGGPDGRGVGPGGREGAGYGVAGYGVAGYGVAGVLLGQDPGLAVVGLCEAGDERRVSDAMRAGARGCVDIRADGPELARSVVAAGRGQAILSEPVLTQLHRGLRADDLEPALTGREREVRSLMEQGLPDKLIAERLVLSVKTVEKHAGAVLRKTGARNRTELAGRARIR